MSKSVLALGVFVARVGAYIAAALLLSRPRDGGHAPWRALIVAARRWAQVWPRARLP